MERNANKVLLTVIAIAVLIVATVGATFAYFSATGGSDEQNIVTGELRITASSSITHGENIKPTEFSLDNAAANKDVAKIGLEVDTNGTTITTGKYNILLSTTGIELKTETDTVKGGSLSDVKWALYDADSSLVADGDFTNGNYTTPTAITVDDEGALMNLPIAQDTDGVAGTAANIDNYTLYIWIENTEDSVAGNGDGVQDRLQGLNITATLNVEAMQ